MTEKNTDVAIIQPQPPARIDIDPQALIAAAIDKNAPIEAIERLLDVRDRIKREMAREAYDTAMGAFQGACPIVIKRKSIKDKSGRDRSKYAPIEDILRQKNKQGITIKELIRDHGFSYTVTTEQSLDPPTMKAIVKISHIAGHSEKTDFTIGKDTNEYMTDPQRWLSSRSFAMRVAFCDGFGIITGDEDIDGNDPKADNKKASDEAKTKAALDKLKALPENIRKGFEILDYKFKAQWQFCEDRKWDHNKIMAEINKIVDRQA